MSDSKELKPKSFRINDETAEKFKEISASIGGNQQEALAKLIETYEFQQGKTVLTEKKSEIEEFEKYVNILTRKFMNILEDNQNVTATVRTEFEAQLKSKDETIKDLQERLKEAKERKEEATRKANRMTEEVERLNQCNIEQEKEFLAKLDGLQDVLKEKENLNSVLSDSCNRFKVQVEQMKGDIDKAKRQGKEFDELQKKYNDLLIISGNLQAGLESLEKEHEEIITEMKQNENEILDYTKQELELKYKTELLNLKEEYQKQILDLKEQKQIEIDKYQSKYYELLEQMNPKKKTTTRRKKEEN